MTKKLAKILTALVLLLCANNIAWAATSLDVETEIESLLKSMPWSETIGRDKYARVEQVGEKHQTTIEQQKGEGLSITDITQSGNANLVEKLTQSGASLVSIDQNGQYNKVTIGQVAGNSDPVGAKINQTGEWNQANLIQDGSDIFASINQDSPNSSPKCIASAVINKATVKQTGHGLLAYIAQINDSSDCDATITQNGNNFQADISQDGNGHTATITQTNLGGTHAMSQAYVVQRDQSQEATIIQGGYGHYAKIEQSGSSHTANINQVDDNNYAYVLQNGVLGGSTVNITQSGNNNEAAVLDHGSGVMPTITQDGSKTVTTIPGIELISGNSITVERDSSGNYTLTPAVTR